MSQLPKSNTAPYNTTGEEKRREERKTIYYDKVPKYSMLVLSINIRQLPV